MLAGLKNAPLEKDFDALIARSPFLQAYLQSQFGAVQSQIQAIQRAGAPKNRLINGAMKVDQRNAGASQVITAGAALAYTVDRWYAYCTGANVNGQRVADVADQFVYQFTGASGVTGIGFAQRIEAANCYDLAGKTTTISLDIANSLLTTVTWTAYYANTIDTFGTLASPTKTQFATGTFTVSGTLSRYSAQVNVPAAATTGIEILYTVGAQVSGTWKIGKAAYESGSIATAFEERQFSDELASCQRYFPAWNLAASQSICAGMCYGTVAAEFSLPYQVQPRVAPTGVIATTNRFCALTSAGAQSAASTVSLNGTASSVHALSLLLTGTSGLVAGNGTILYTIGGSASIFATGCEL